MSLSGPADITLSDLRGRLTVSVPVAGRALSLGRDAAYAAAARGEIPTLRLGRRLVVPVPRLLELVGAPTTDMSDGPGATPEPTATTDEAVKEPRRDDPALRAV